VLKISRLSREEFVIIAGYGVLKTRYNHIQAGIAQLVEQLLRKQLVGGSSPLSGTNIEGYNRGLNTGGFPAQIYREISCAAP
jgi:hypothetical protein